jgi:hypothetical protein
MTSPTKLNRLASRGYLHAAFEHLHKNTGNRNADGTWNTGKLASAGLVTVTG